MIDFLASHAKEIIGFVAGALGGSLVTFKFMRQNRIQGSGTIADQSRAQAGGDVVGRDKTVSSNRS